MEKVFSQGEEKSWVLFFDEADALFGKRIQTAGANDQFANQNVSYLLQRIERFNGIVILASNFKDNFDQAFFRRFDSMVYFPLPTEQQRLIFWQQGFSEICSLEDSIDLNMLAKKHILSGAQINNVIRFVSLKALSAHRNEIWSRDINEGIQRQKNSNATDVTISEENEFDIFDVNS
jgi:SpoVK/Ycf46/Vps4 family AAA+-type ATPase